MSDRKDVRLTFNAATRRQMIAGAAVALGGIAVGSIDAWAGAEDGISHTAESIHQEPVFKASRKHVYEALTDAKQFDRVVRLGIAMRGMSAGAKPTQISGEAGAAFSLFGGYVTGRNVDLVPNQRIVQAWRAGGWDPGIYSIVRFELTEQGSGTKIVFDHTGFPEGKAQHLADGWKGNYWEPLEKYLVQAQGS
jgi:uncharacterized protein YndB with AHSA1/START domain